MSSLQRLALFIGTSTKVGTLTLPVGSETDFSFHYEPDWIKSGFPISPHIPFHAEASPRSIENYLRNLLPEGEAFDEMVQNSTISRSNTFALIRKLGSETSGALSFRMPDSEPEATCFRPVAEQELVDRLERNLAPLVYWDGKVRLSVAGVQSKLNLLKRDGEWGFGEGKLCSTYILKFESGKAPCIAANEFFCMTLASLIGLDVASVELARIGKTRTLIIERFDRRLVQERGVVQRMHVIDGCQATDLPPSYKYERQNGDTGEGSYLRDGVSFPRLLNLETADNLLTHQKLAQWMMFNLAILNYDAHGKNLSFFVKRAGLELAPFYDLVNVEAIVKEGKKRNLQHNPSAESAGRAASLPQYFAMSVGGWQREDFMAPPQGNFQPPITAYDLAEFGELLGYSSTRMVTLLLDTVNAIEKALATAQAHSIKQGIDEQEQQHIALCVALIKAECQHLREQAEGIPEMYELL